MEVSVIHLAKKLPHLKWAIFQLETEGMFCPCGKDIMLDVINEQSFCSRFKTLCHELVHYFLSPLPYELRHPLNILLDVTDGNRPELLHGIDEADQYTVVLHIFD